MNLDLFFLSLAIAAAAPLIAVHYMRPLLLRVINSLCDNAEGAGEFWVRSAYLLAVSGTMILMLMFGDFRSGANPVEMLRMTLLLVFCGVFVTIAFISGNVWRQVGALTRSRRRLEELKELREQTPANPH